VAGSCGDVNEALGYTKVGEFREHLTDCLLLKKDSGVWSDFGSLQRFPLKYQPRDHPS
jgi:hypothetical protein